MNFFLQYFIYIVISIAAGTSVSFFFYYRSKNQQFNGLIKRTLFLLRATSVSLVVFVIFNPRIIFTSHEEIKPLLMVAFDNSQSIKYLNDTIQLLKQIEKVENELKVLEKTFDVHRITFGERVCDTCALNFQESETNLSAVFDHINLNFQINRPRALILATDGLANAGTNVANRIKDLDMPVFAVLLADTTKVEDYWIASILNNPVVFANNRFPVEIEIRRTTTIASNVKVEIEYKGKPVAHQNIDFQSDEERAKVIFQIEATSPGVHQYEVVLTTNSDERNLENNKTHFAIDVVESETHILLLYNAPSPDIGLLRQSISKSKAYKLDIQHTASFNGDFKPYSVVIFMHLPSGDFGADRFVADAVKQNCSIWFFVGSQTNLTMLNQLNLGWQFSRSGKKLDLVYPTSNQTFSYFSIPPIFASIMAQLPPLYTQFGRWSVSTPSEIALLQQIGTVETSNPLLLTSMTGNRRVALLTGEGIWRWGMYMTRTFGNPSGVYDLIHQTIQFLSVKPLASPFKLQVKPIWSKNANIFVDAFVYNFNYQLVNDKSVEIIIESSEGKKTSLNMRPHEQSYRTFLGALPVGVYSATGIYKTDSLTYTDKKTFAVTDLNIEKLASGPDFPLMRSITGNESNNLIFNTEIEGFSQHVLASTDAETRYSSTRTVADIIVFTFILFLIVICTTFEWFLRKYHGQL